MCVGLLERKFSITDDISNGETEIVIFGNKLIIVFAVYKSQIAPSINNDTASKCTVSKDCVCGIQRSGRLNAVAGFHPAHVETKRAIVIERRTVISNRTIERALVNGQHRGNTNRIIVKSIVRDNVDTG